MLIRAGRTGGIGQSRSFKRAAVMPVRAIVTQNQQAGANSSITSLTGHAFYWPRVISQDATTIATVWKNWYGDNNGEQDNSYVVTIAQAAIIANGVAVANLFGGSNSYAMAAGEAIKESDHIPASAFGLLKFSEGDLVWVKGYMTVPTAGDKFPTSTVDKRHYAGTVGSAAQSIYFNPGATTLSATVATGVYTTTGTAPAVQNGGYCPFVVGTVVSDENSEFIIGDSIAAGVGDSFTAGLHGIGYLQRASDVGGGKLMSSMNFSRAGDTSNTKLGTNVKWKEYLKYCNCMMNEFNQNDITFFTLSQIQASEAQLIGIARSAGYRRADRTTLLPGVTGTFATVAGQTPTAKSIAGGLRDQLTAWQISQEGILYDKVLLTGATVEDSVQRDRWAGSDSTPSSVQLTNDGIHPNYAAVTTKIVQVVTAHYATLI